ncbi:S-layer homology domain-containing protein [Ammoniphilus sp. 3BR4]|uniref:S-layer homology domain-containing protein n=1 Tax=Ammoniphilus sp. 3BR4 TaxID=3158265 RepID=UPI00346749DB
MMRRGDWRNKGLAVCLAWVMLLITVLGGFSSQAVASNQGNVKVRVEGSIQTLANVQVQAGPTALDALIAAMGESQLDIEQTQYGSNINAISGERRTEDYSSSWWYYVKRGGSYEYPSVTADQFSIYPGDEIVFYYSTWGVTKIPDVRYQPVVLEGQTVTLSVYGEDGEPTVGASVYFENQVFSIDQHGQAVLPGQPVGNYSFTVRHEEDGIQKLVRTDELYLQVVSDMVERDLAPPAFKGNTYDSDRKVLMVTGDLQEPSLAWDSTEKLTVEVTIQKGDFSQTRRTEAQNYAPYLIVFTGIDPGEYTISLKAIDQYGNESVPDVRQFSLSKETSTEQAALTKAIAYLKTKQKANGRFDDWTAMALAQAGENLQSSLFTKDGKQYVDHLKADVQALAPNVSYTTDYARLAMAVSAIGQDPRDFYGINLIDVLKSRVDNNGHYGLESERTWVNSHAWAILALHAADEPVPQAEQAKAWLVQQQNADGGWGFSTDYSFTDPDMTAYAIRALAALGVGSSDGAVQKAVDYFKTLQNQDGGMKQGWTASSSNVFTTTEVIKALLAVFLSPTSDTWKKGDNHLISYLLSNQELNGQLANERGTSGLASILMDMGFRPESTNLVGGETTSPSGTLSVKMTITGRNGENFFNRSLSLPKGSTVMDAILKANQEDPSLQVRTNSSETYVSSIKGQEAEGLIGWNYRLNGVKPDTIGAAEMPLSDGDQIEWFWASASEGAYANQINPIPAGTPQEVIERLSVQLEDLLNDTGSKVIGEDRLSGEGLKKLTEFIQNNRFELKQKVEIDKDTVIKDEQEELVLYIPAQSLTTETEITARKWKAEETDVLKHAKYVSPIYEFGPAGTYFEKPIAIQLKVAIPEAASVDHLILAWYDEEKKRWIPIPSVLDISQGVIVGTVDHFTKFAVLKSPEFPDVTASYHWAEDAIYSLAQQNVIHGINGAFQPGGAIKRGEFMTLLAKALHLDESVSAEQLKVSFRDVEQHWARSFIAQAYHAGWVKGYSDGTFRPEQTITRMEMATLLVQAFGNNASAKNEEKVREALKGFADQKDIPAWGKISAVNAIQAGWIKGKSNGTRFAPFDTATRAEAAVMVYQSLYIK